MTEPAATDSMLELVRKLLAKAENPACTPEEAAAFNDKAAALIAKYGIDAALLAAANPETDPVGDRVIVVLAPFALDKAGLLATVAVALRCRSVRRKVWQGDGYVYQMHLFGFASDLERAELLFTSLLVQASFGIASAEVPYGDSPAAFRRSWLVGFSYAVGKRLTAAEQRATSDATATTATSPTSGPSVALVLADRGSKVDQRVEEAYPKLRPTAPRQLRGSGRQSGYAAGQRADLGGTRVGQRTGRAVSR